MSNLSTLWGGSGDVNGPASATDNAAVRFDAATGKLIQNSLVLITDTGEVQAGDGSATTPTYSFSSDPNTGIYSAGADSLGFAVGGSNALTLGSTDVAVGSGFSLSVRSGAAATPSLRFATDTDTGVYSITTNQLGISAGGIGILGVTTTGVTILNGIVDVPSGLISAPTYSFTGDLDTGFYASAANEISAAAGGVQVWKTQTAANGGLFVNNLSTGAGLERVLTTSDLGGGGVSGPVSSTNNAVALWNGTGGTVLKDSFLTTNTTFGSLYANGSSPGFKWNETDHTGDNRLWDALALSGVLTFRCLNDTESGATSWMTVTRSGNTATAININATTLNLNATTTIDLLETNDGSNSAPTHSFINDPDTGIYLAGVNQLGVTAGGVALWRTVAAASGGMEINNLSTGAGFERVLTTSDLGGGGGAPVGASYLTLGTDVTLTSERVLTAGDGVAFVDGGAGSTLTINIDISPLTAIGTTDPANDLLIIEDVTDGSIRKVTPNNLGITGGSGAPTTASYLVISADATLSAERVITMGSGLAASDGGANGAYTINIDISPLTAIGTTDPANDLLIIEDVTDGSIRKVTPNNLGLGSGGVSGPGSSTNNAVALWNGTGGTVLKDSTVTVNTTFGSVYSNGTAPGFKWNETDHTANNRLWDAIALTGVLTYRLLNDAESSATTWLEISRSANTITGISFKSQITNAVGSAGTPSYSFNGDTNTGMYNAAADQLGFSTGGTVVGRFTSTDIFFLNHGTTATAANAVLNSTTGALQRSTSSIKFKDNVQTFEDDLLDKLRVVTYTSKIDNDGKETQLGLIAEETPPLVTFYDHLGNPNGVKYDRVGLVAIDELQKLRKLEKEKKATAQKLKEELKEAITVDQLKSIMDKILDNI